MNVIFCLTVIASLVFMTINNPDGILLAFLSGAEKAVNVCVELLIIYTLWSGIFKIMENCGALDFITKLLSKPVKMLFGNTDTKINKLICTNIAANFLGLSGVATPAGIKAQQLLEREKNQKASDLLFAVAASPLQIIPITVLTIAAKYGSYSPQKIILPCILTSLICSLTAIILVKVFK